MKLKSKLGLLGSGALLLVLAACGGDGFFTLDAAVEDNNVSAAEANVLLRNAPETGEPENVSNLTLRTSETDEPFDLPN